jgi:hypothetical protein
MSLDRQCGLSNLENIKEQDDEIENKIVDDMGEQNVSDGEHHQGSKEKNHEAVSEDETLRMDQEENKIHVQSSLVHPAAFTERSSHITKSPFDEDLNESHQFKDKSIPQSPAKFLSGSKKKTPQKTSSNKKMKMKQKSTNLLINSKALAQSSIEYTQQMLQNCQLSTLNRSSWRNKRISDSHCVKQPYDDGDEGHVSMSKTYNG